MLLSRIAASPPVERAISSRTLLQLYQARRRGQERAAALAVVQRARGLKRREQQDSAQWLLERAARILRGCDAQAIVQIEAGLVLSVASPSAVTDVDALLRETDAAWKAGEDQQVVQLLDLALQHLFHAREHFGAQLSALSVSPQAFLAPLRASLAWQAVTAPLQFNQPNSERPSNGEETHLLFISLKNWNFVQGIVEDYRSDPRCQVRTLDLLDLPARPTLTTLLQARLTLARQGGETTLETVLDAVGGVPESVRDDLAWADTIFVEWGSAAAVWASLVTPVLAPSARLLVRVHSFEAFTAMPQLVHWGGVHTLLTVAPAIREILRASVQFPASLTLDNLPNRAELARYRLEKSASARRTLALVGWAQLVKDPAWALDVLELLRQQDPAWRLLLIGPDFPHTPPAAEIQYTAEVSARIAQLGDAVEITGRTADVPKFLQRAGIILSSPLREGTHQGFVEGTASGALPVCRDWPHVAQWGGARELFPREWIVQSPQEAAERILALADDEDTCAQASEWVFQHADWDSVRGQYDELLLGQ